MRFTCSAPDFQEGLSVVTRALSGRTTMPILECVLVRAQEDGKIVLTCSDGDISIVTSIDADILEPGSAALPGKLLSDVAKKMPQNETVLVESNGTSVTVKCPGVRMTMSAQPGNDFPALPVIDESEKAVLDKNTLRDLIGKTSFAVALEDEQRKILTGCLLDLDGTHITMVGMDGFRMAYAEADTERGNIAMKAVIQGRVLSEIGKILSDAKTDTEAELLVAGTQMALLMGRTRLYAGLLSGEYISYRNILPKSFATKVRVRESVLTTAVNRVSLMAQEGKTSILCMDIEQDRMVITANSANGEAYEEIPIELEGNPLKIAFNVRYIADTVKALEEEEIVMSFNSSVQPCLMLPAEGNASGYLVLPVRMGL